MIAVQGPEAIEPVQPFVEARGPALEHALLHLRQMHASMAPIRSSAAPATQAKTASRSFATPTSQSEFGSTCMSGGQAVGGMAAGLGARDTLRLEAAMPLYGHELSAKRSTQFKPA